VGKISYSFSMTNPVMTKTVYDYLHIPISPEFMCANIEDFGNKYADRKNWLNLHFLNGGLKKKYRDEIDPAIIQMIRKTNAAIEYYEIGRSRVQLYLEQQGDARPSVKKLFDALDAWESFFLLINSIIDIYKNMMGKMDMQIKAFNRKDGSKEQRAYDIGNCIKHFSELDLIELQKQNVYAPLWISNDGFESVQFKISYNETHDLIQEIAELIKIIVYRKA